MWGRGEGRCGERCEGKCERVWGGVRRVWGGLERRVR